MYALATSDTSCSKAFVNKTIHIEQACHTRLQNTCSSAESKVFAAINIFVGQQLTKLTNQIHVRTDDGKNLLSAVFENLEK